MVYLPRSSDSTCLDWLALRSEDIRECQTAGTTPYCSPLNGSRICSGTISTIPLRWPSKFYHPDAFIFIDFGDQYTQGPNALGWVHAAEGAVDLDNFMNYTERTSNVSRSDERTLRTTIREWWRHSDGYLNATYEGPTLILVTDERTTPSASPVPDGSHYPPGKIVGITFGSLVGVVFLLMIFFSCCKSCCIGCCCKGKSEEERLKRRQDRRVAQECAAVQPEVDAIKAGVAQGVIRTGPVRPGGIWTTDMPRRASRPFSIRSGRSDDIRAVTVVGDQRAEECRIEGQRAEQRRQEDIVRAEETEPPAYEAPPPKYTP